MQKVLPCKYNYLIASTEKPQKLSSKYINK